MKWAYGVTTVPSRRHNLLPRTLNSLRCGGLENPILFVDGNGEDYKDLSVSIVRRSPQIGAFGNWILSLHELWIRNPRADRYALFQDDILLYLNLKEYLERTTTQINYYWNLYTIPENEKLKTGIGWYESNQLGRGALALVFTKEGVRALLSHPLIVGKPNNAMKPDRNLDGVVLNALRNSGINELVHYPTLVQHTGEKSTLGTTKRPLPTSFLGEEYNAVDLLNGSKNKKVSSYIG